jgi:hypothetical protein
VPTVCWSLCTQCSLIRSGLELYVAVLGNFILQNRPEQIFKPRFGIRITYLPTYLRHCPDELQHSV